MDSQTIIGQAGPLPISTTFEALSDGPALIMLSGSVWTQQADSLIGVELSIDETPLAAAKIFANSASTHMAVVPILIPYTFTLGRQHEIFLGAATTNTVSDQNDFFQVTILY